MGKKQQVHIACTLQHILNSQAGECLATVCCAGILICLSYKAPFCTSEFLPLLIRGLRNSLYIPHYCGRKWRSLTRVSAAVFCYDLWFSVCNKGHVWKCMNSINRHHCHLEGLIFSAGPSSSSNVSCSSHRGQWIKSAAFTWGYSSLGDTARVGISSRNS